MSEALAAVATAAAGLATMPLERVMALAELQTRTDRKYVMAPELLARMTAEVGTAWAVLEIDGARAFRYESVYFDTPALDSYHGAAHGHRHRFKVRTRSYLDSGACALEVKTRSGRDETVKHRLAYELSNRRRLTAEGLHFVIAHVRLPEEEARLRPVLTTSYRRTTLIDAVAGTRLTCDAGLVCSAGDGREVSLEDHLVVETKSWGPPTPADRYLWRAGCRPVTASKYCLGLAALHPELPANKWNQTLRRYFAWSPQRER